MKYRKYYASDFRCLKYGCCYVISNAEVLVDVDTQVTDGIIPMYGVAVGNDYFGCHWCYCSWTVL